MNKILILSLGTGSVLGRTKQAEWKQLTDEEKQRHVRQIVEDNTFVYRSAEYQIGDRIAETEFIGDLLIREENPNEVIIIGTVKSSWSTFYAKFTSDTGLDPETCSREIQELIEIEEAHGKDTGTEELNALQNRVETLYNKRLKYYNGDGDRVAIQTKIIMIRYGINEEELLENYNRIKQIRECFAEGKTNEISFDITHSFRSLPVYNLVLLNYFRQISNFRVSIAHIYYGNFDIKGENNNRAPVVDLKDMMKMLDMTSAVHEFATTGNSISLINQLGGGEEALKEALTSFDWATQINLGKSIYDAIGQIRASRPPQVSNRYTDAFDMIQEAMSAGDFSLWDSDRYNVNDEFQHALGRWYLKQNRYGLALATGQEALRSYCVPFYLEFKGKNVNDAAVRNENNRKSAYDRLEKISELFPEENRPAAARHLIDAWTKCEKIKPFRNAFAHNLWEEDAKTGASYETVRKEIHEFYETLDRIRDDIRNNRAEFSRVFKKKRAIKKKDRTGGKHVRLFIFNSMEALGSGNAALRGKAKSKNTKRTYLLQCLPDGMIDSIANYPKKSAKRFGDVYLLEEYLRRHYENAINEGRLNIILMSDLCDHGSGLTLSQIIAYGSMACRLLSGGNVWICSNEYDSYRLLAFPIFDNFLDMNEEHKAAFLMRQIDFFEEYHKQLDQKPVNVKYEMPDVKMNANYSRRR